MESSRPPNRTSCRDAEEELDWSRRLFGKPAYDEIPCVTNVPYQTEIIQQHQLATHYRGDESVNLPPRTLDDYDEFLYFQKLREEEKEERLERRLRELIASANRLSASEMQELVDINQEYAMRRIFEGRRTVTVGVKSLCMKRVNQYIEFQKSRPKDNNIEYWNSFVAKFFHPGAQKRWCLSMYSHPNTQEIPMGGWKCELCNKKPGKGFEASYEILPQLFKTKYDSGIIDELYALNEPSGRYSTTSRKLTIIYEAVVQHTTYEKFRVVRDGKLLVHFSPDLKILSFEFCSIRHQELIPRSLVLQQVRQIKDVADCHKTYNQTKKSEEVKVLRRTCKKFYSFARSCENLVEAPGPLLDMYGYNKLYVQALMIYGISKGMEATAEFSYPAGIGPTERHPFLNDGLGTAFAVQSHVDDDEGEISATE